MAFEGRVGLLQRSIKRPISASHWRRSGLPASGNRQALDFPRHRSLAVNYDGHQTSFYISRFMGLFAALTAEMVSQTHVITIIVTICILGLADKTVFLCVRAEHYVLTTVCFYLVMIDCGKDGCPNRSLVVGCGL